MSITSKTPSKSLMSGPNKENLVGDNKELLPQGPKKKDRNVFTYMETECNN